VSTHVVTSHGADFFGEDRFTVKQLRELGQHVRGVLPYDDSPPLTKVLDDAGEGEREFGADQAALLAVLLRRAAAHRALQKKHAAVASLLGQSAARAAGDNEPWTWTPHNEGER
jgi:hypothetical protein